MEKNIPERNLEVWSFSSRAASQTAFSEPLPEKIPSAFRGMGLLQPCYGGNGGRGFCRRPQTGMIETVARPGGRGGSKIDMSN